MVNYKQSSNYEANDITFTKVGEHTERIV